MSVTATTATTVEPPATRGLWVGTSGWSYKHWRGVFYPSSLPSRRWLEYYSGRFATAEVNYSFYRLPSESTLRAWVETVPAGFLFAVKGSRYITHVLRLRGAAEATALFMNRVDLLGDGLGPVLWQLPPTLERDTALLAQFAAVLPPGRRHVFEFRHPSWHTDEVWRLLHECGCHLCVHDWGTAAAPRLVIGDLAYVRLHGGRGGEGGKYATPELQSWADWIRASRESASVTFYVYFNNDALGNAVADAQALLGLVAGGSSGSTDS